MTEDPSKDARKDLGDRKLLVIIPAWNEEDVISVVFEAIRSSAIRSNDVLVVSDGSTDNTAEIARAAGVSVIELPINLGVGGAMRAGFLYAVRHKYDWAVQLDADGQHDPNEVVTLFEEASETGANVVIGARFAGAGEYSVRGPRKWAMKTLSFVMSKICGTRLDDTTSGFKLYDSRALDLFSREYPAEYLGDTIEALIIARRSGLKIAQVGVQMFPRAGGTPSNSPMKAAKNLIRSVFAIGIALSRTRESEVRK